MRRDSGHFPSRTLNPGALGSSHLLMVLRTMAQTLVLLVLIRNICRLPPWGSFYSSPMPAAGSACRRELGKDPKRTSQVGKGRKRENCKGGAPGGGVPGHKHHTAKPREETFWHLNTRRKEERERGKKHVASGCTGRKEAQDHSTTEIKT